MAEQVAQPDKPAEKKPAPKPPTGGTLDILRDVVLVLADGLVLAGQAALAILGGRFAARDLLKQMAVIGADALWIVLTISLVSGSVFGLYVGTFAVSLGFVDPVGGTLAIAYLNELGPVLGGIAFAARSGAAVAAEIGTMVVTEQVEALKAMAVSPLRYLVAPRVLAAVLMFPLLTVLADLAGVTGGYLTATNYGVPHQVFIESIYKYATVKDLTNGLIKSFVFAFLIGVISCQQGLRTEGGATGVGRSTTRSVVLCVVMITLADLVLAVLLQQTNR